MLINSFSELQNTNFFFVKRAVLKLFLNTLKFKERMNNKNTVPVKLSRNVNIEVLDVTSKYNEPA